MRPAKKEKPSGRVRAGALIGIAILALVCMEAGVAGASPAQSRQATGQFGVSITILPPGQTPAHGTVSFHGEVIGKGSRLDETGDVVGYYTAPGCYLVQFRGWASPVVACGHGGALIGIGRPVRVRGVVEGGVRQRQGPFLDVVPLVRGTVELEGNP